MRTELETAKTFTVEYETNPTDLGKHIARTIRENADIQGSLGKICSKDITDENLILAQIIAYDPDLLNRAVKALVHANKFVAEPEKGSTVAFEPHFSINSGTGVTETTLNVFLHKTDYRLKRS